MADPDSIVIGAGTAGCVVARRLFDAGRTVCLVEAGPGEPRPPAILGPDPVAAAEAATRQWPGLLAAPSLDGPRYRYRQGFGIGGGSSINAMILSPGDDVDYERWVEEYRCPEWHPELLRPWVDRVIASWPTRTATPGPVTEAFTGAAAEAGHPVGGDSLDRGRLGVLQTRLAMVGDRRQSSFDQYLADLADLVTAPDADRLQVLTGRSVTRILTEGVQTTGVVLDDGTELRAAQVVICAGAVATPRLLRASGIGRPTVGSTLRDHPSFVFTIGCNRDAVAAVGPAQATTDSDGAAVTGGRLVSRLLRWSSGSADRSGDLQAFVMERVDDGQPGSPQLAAVVVGLMDVTSVGRIGDSEAAGGPHLITGALTTAADRSRLRAGVRQVHQLLASSVMRAVADQVFLDDKGTDATALATMSDAELDRLILANPGPYSHPAASCPMGPVDEPGAVVSSKPEEGGRLHGHRGVHVIDASIMPQLVRGGLQLPVTVMAERLVAGLVEQAG